MKKRITSIALVFCMLMSCFAMGTFVSNAVTTDAGEVSASVSSDEVSASDYGLADNIQDGVILHCFDWKYSDIEAELENIAEAGFTSIQTSPAQGAGTTSTQVWYMLYQPTNFSITANSLGTKAELQSLCEAAEEYGINVIVDVVANHLRGSGYSGNGVDSSLARDNHSDYFHGYDNSGIDYSNRWQITHYDIGMADLNSENEELVSIIYDYTQELKSVGVDGIRWDAAKHIGLPSEGTDFWSIMSENGLYNYGEILTGAVDDGSGDDLMAEYSSFISVTDSSYSDTVVQSVLNGSVTSSTGNWNTKGVSDDKILYWAESHDTYSNDGSYGTNSSEWSQNDVDRAYAILAAKADATTLYFSRPSETSKNSIMAGVKGSTHFTSAEVAEVNKFHNAMIGKAESYVAENGNAAVCREDGGAVIVTGSEGGGYVSITNGDSYVPEGDYIDQVSGNTFTVTSSTISGTVGSTGIAVIYNASTTPRASVSPESTTYNTDTLTLTLSCTNASSAQYSLDGGTTWTSYTNGQTITIGSDVDYGEATTVTVKASDGTTTSKEKSYTYTKVDPSAVQTIYFDNSSYGWSGVYVYIYLNGQYAPWPGTKMSLVSGSSTLYYFEVPEGYENALVIFTESSTATDNRYPADQEPGVPLNGCSMIMKADYEWVEYTGSESATTATQATTASTAATEATQATTASTAATEATLPTASGRVLIGDANGDGVITISDATEIQKHVAGITYLSGNNAVAGDVDQSGYIDVKDATFVQKYLVDLFNDAAYCGQYIGEEETSAASATSAQTETQADSGNYIYFKNSDDWSQPYAYYWSGDNTYMTSWPGEAMTEVSDGIYRIEIPSDAEYIIFNPGSDNGKTEDLTIPGMNYIYENGSWSVYNG